MREIKSVYDCVGTMMEGYIQGSWGRWTFKDKMKKSVKAGPRQQTIAFLNLKDPLPACLREFPL